MRTSVSTLIATKMGLSKRISALALGALIAAPGALGGCSPSVFETFGNFDDELNACGVDVSLIGDPSHDPDLLPPLLKQTAPSKARLYKQNLNKPWMEGRKLKVDGDTIYVADSDNGDVVTVDRHTLKPGAKTHTGGGPEQLVVGPDHTVYTTLRHSGEVARIENGKITGRWKVGYEPIGLAMSPDARFLFVAVATEDRLLVLDAKTGAKLHAVETADRPRVVAVGPNLNGQVRVLVGHQNPEISRQGNFKMTNKGATVYSYSSKNVKGSGEAAYGQGYFAFTNSKGLSVGLREGNPAHGPDKTTSFRAKQGVTGLTPVRVSSAAVNPENGDFVVAHMLASPGTSQDTLDQAFPKKSKKPTSGSSYGSSSKSAKACNSTPTRPMEPSVSVIGSGSYKTGRAQDRQVEFAIADPDTGRNMLAGFDQPSDVNYHPTATMAFMTSMGTDNVLVLNTASGDPLKSPIAKISVGHAPTAIDFSVDGKKAYVLNGHDWTVSEIDLTGLLHKGVFQDTSYTSANSGHTKAGTAPQISKVLKLQATAARTAKFGEDPMPEQMRLGRRLFHWTSNPKLSKSGRFACASCHFEGSEDKQVWHIADGARQTPALAGRLHGTGPFNWQGTEDHLTTNMGKTIERMGGKGLNKVELEALEQFLVKGLVEPPNPNRMPSGLTADQEAGRKLFFDPVVACASCHVGSETTDGKVYDVGTATSVERTVAKMRDGKTTMRFNTPSLRGLHATGPYLHDGSAKTLMDVLNRTAGKMGDVRKLSYKQRQQLVEYMQTL